jgi:hypothetical protein
MPPRWNVEGEASVVGAVGLLPGAALGARLDLGLRLARVRVGAEATLWPRVQSREVTGIRMQAWHAGGVGCFAVAERESYSVDVCLGAQAGVVTGQGLGWTRTQTQSPVLLTAWPEIALRAGRLGPLRAGVAAGALVPLGRYRFYGDTAGGRLDVAVLQPVIPAIRLEIGLISTQDGSDP